MGGIGVQPDAMSAGLARAGLGEPQCEVLFELFSGNAGAIQLGRLLKGNDAGRLVALRRLSHKPGAELASAMDLARSIAHPRLAKVLGTIRDGDAWYVASEYISGVTLFELGQMVTSRRVRLDTAVAVRIILDALRAGDDARRLLADTANLHGVRCVYPESIWVAEFGEIFLSELLVMPLLAVPADDPGIPAAVADVRAALVALVWLVRGEQTAGQPAGGEAAELPAELSEILRAGAGSDGSPGYATLEQLIDALAGLGDAWVATEQQVSLELQRVMGLVLGRRRQKLGMLERASELSSDHSDDDDATRCFRVAVKGEQHDTARPPAGAHGDADGALAAAASLRNPRAAEFAADPALGSNSDPIATPEPTASAPALDASANPISAVWRQAKGRLDSSARRAAKGVLPAANPPPQVQSALLARPVALNGAPAASTRVATAATVVLALGVALAVTAAIHWIWSSNTRPAPGSPTVRSHSGL